VCRLCSTISYDSQAIAARGPPVSQKESFTGNPETVAPELLTRFRELARPEESWGTSETRRFLEYAIQTGRLGSSANNSFNNNLAGFHLAYRGNLSVTVPVTNPETGTLSNLEAVIIKRKHIDHAELLELGKMLLLPIKRQQITLVFSSLTEPDRRVTEVEELARVS
jgi:hypothetical protein